ncbi:glycoside hydrolase family 9 protein [Sphaerobolus stellatus SS14]|nr:glycoside hydrolase family 9 protein [Sphaerobolus stellatus SS14]
MTRTGIVSLFLLPLVSAQLSLPSPPYLPPESLFGASPSSSPHTPNVHWSTLLGNLLYFYEAQRSGNLPSSNRVGWRNSSALSDGQDANVDLSGGYFDAGDYVKCTFPLSFTLMSTCWGALDYGEGYDLANQTPYLDAMIRWGMDWMVNAHPNPRTLFVQVADSQTDTSYWGGDQGIPGPRPSFQINDTSPGTDAAAQASAAFAACSLLYAGQPLNATARPASLRNTTYAQILLSHATQLYDFALNAAGGQVTYQKSVPQVAETYPSTSFGDELTIASLFLSYAVANATANNISVSSNFSAQQLASQAETYWQNFSLGGLDGALNWDDKTPAIPVLFSQIIHVHPSLSNNASAWPIEAERYFDNIVEQRITKETTYSFTDNGLLWYDGVSDTASLNPALNAAMLMLRYAPLTSNSTKRALYQSFAMNQLNYALGKNPMSVPYIVGSNPNSPSNPHSALASGGSNIDAIDTEPLNEAHVLYGGVVGGPDKQDRYFDIRSDWPETEVALDYVAPMLSLAAYNTKTNAQDPFYTSLKAGLYAQERPNGKPCDSAFPCWITPLKEWQQILIGVVVGLVSLTFLVLGGYWIWLCVADARKY